MITSPSLLLDKRQCLANINQMADKAERHRVTLKPHFKTHQSAAVGEWFRDNGVEEITVSSVKMGHYFADRGWNDITIAFPVNIRETEAINELADEIEQLSLLVQDIQTAQYLIQHLKWPVRIYIEIDTGAERSGLLPDNLESITKLVELFDSTDKLHFRGFYSHPGHSYSARSKEQIRKIHLDVLSTMRDLKNHFPQALCCIGDTPCCSVADDFDGIDEISPGNFVFYDLMQVQIGSCSIKDIAVAMAAPVVAKYPQRKEVILHCGAVHLSKELLKWKGDSIYGLPVILDKNSWSSPAKDSYLKSLSQEHGVLTCGGELYRSIAIGDLVGILPVHSCLTANLMGHYYSLDKKALII